MRNTRLDWRQALNRIKSFVLLWPCCAEHRQRLHRLEPIAQAHPRTDAPANDPSIVLQHRIVEIESERDAARREVRMLQSALAHASCRRAGQLNWPTLAASVLLVVGALASATTFQDSPYGWRKLTHADPALALPDGMEPLAVDKTSGEFGVQPDAPATTARPRNRVRGVVQQAVHRQWGPPLLLPPAAASGVVSRVAFDPLLKQKQTDLLTLGFDLGGAGADGLQGPRTQQALAEFQLLYVSPGGMEGGLDAAGLASLLSVYAALAHRDAARFAIDRGVLAAIRLGSVRTGVEFSFLMELAAAESNFDPVAQAAGSSATGLYQFTHDTWLNSIKSYGANYGLGIYADQIEYNVNRRGTRRPVIQNAEVYEHVLALRSNPRVAALMAAESLKEQMPRLAAVLGREPARTDLYLTHFFGPTEALSFLKLRDEDPGGFAAEVFPEAAQHNRDIFHPARCQPRTLEQVYELFSSKFDTSRYEAWRAN